MENEAALAEKLIAANEKMTELERELDTFKRGIMLIHLRWKRNRAGNAENEAVKEKTLQVSFPSRNRLSTLLRMKKDSRMSWRRLTIRMKSWKERWRG